MWRGIHAPVMHRHDRHLKPFIHTIIEGRKQTRVHDLSLAVNIKIFSTRSTVLPRLWLWRVPPVSSGLLGKMRRSEGNLPTRSATLFQAVPLRIVERGRRGSAPVPKPVDVWKQACEVAGSEERRLRLRDDAHGCHVRTSCHVKYCFQRGVERPLIGCLPRTLSSPRLVQQI